MKFPWSRNFSVSILQIIKPRQVPWLPEVSGTKLTHVNPRPFHLNVWQNSLQKKKKKCYHYYYCLIGLSNIDQKLNCPPSLLFQFCGLPADLEACVKAPGSFSSYLSIFYDSLGRNTPGKNTSWQSKVLMFKSILLVLSLRQQAEVIYCEIWKSSTLVQFLFPCIIVPVCTWNSHIFTLPCLFSLAWICHCSLLLSYRSACLLPGSSGTKPPLHARKVVYVALAFFSST